MEWSKGSSAAHLGTKCFAMMNAGVPLCGENMHYSQVQKVISSLFSWSSLVAQTMKNLLAMQETGV